MTDLPPRVSFVLRTVVNAMSTKENKVIHYQKSTTLGDHYRVSVVTRLTRAELVTVIQELEKTKLYRKVVVENTSWTKAWLATTVGIAVRLYL